MCWRTHCQEPREMDKVELRRCEKIEKSGTDSPFRAGQLRIFKRLRGAKKVSGPGFSIFSHLLGLSRSTLDIVEAAAGRLQRSRSAPCSRCAQRRSRRTSPVTAV